MDDVIVVEDRLDGQCVRHLHLMSNEEIGMEVLHAYGMSATTVKIERGETTESHYVKAEWIYRGVWDVNAACREGKFRRLMVWSLGSTFQVSGSKSLSVRDGARQAAAAFERFFRFAPKYLFVRRLPRGAENCMDVQGMILLEAEWMLERAVAVGGRRTPPQPSPNGRRSFATLRTVNLGRENEE